jgi:predicted nucleic acid-binding protein
MPDVVLDASLALRWVLRDEHSAPAEVLRTRWADGEVRVVVPHLFWGEIANGLYQAYRRDRVSWEEVQEGFLLSTSSGILVIDASAEVHQRALELARALNADTPYDLIYVALAQSLEVEFWHCDRRLTNLLEGRYPWVKYVG